MSPGFNSILVRLKVQSLFMIRVLLTGFNSILVRLKVQPTAKPYELDKRFNSILVRLKDDAHQTLSQESIRFQFHTGSIKSLLRPR